MHLYTLHNNSYRDIKYLDKPIAQPFYINLTNKCPCSCTFCLRQTKEMLENNSLWLKEEPTAEVIINELKEYDLKAVPEIIFCGFGEPTEKLEVIVEVATYLKATYPTLKLRINTNGLGNLIHGYDISEKFANLIDTVSISLNASNAEEYFKLTRSKFGIESFDAMLEFASLAKKSVPNVVLSVVDIIGEEEISKCQAICDKLGVKLRVRVFEE